MIALHGQRLGTPGAPPAVLAHCFLGNGGSWRRLLAAMAPLDALSLDLPGHGASPMPDSPGDFHALTADAITAQVAQPSLLIGHSFGAASMLRHALHHPQTVTGLVLIEPVFFAAARGMPAYDPYRESERALHGAVRAGDLEHAAREFLALNPGSPSWESLPAPVQRQMAAQMPLVSATEPGLFGDSGGLCAPGVMEGFDPPVLLLVGSGTTPIFHATVKALAQRLPRAEVAVIPGAGHMVPISHPTETAQVIDAWIRRTGQPTAATENPCAG
ncbi:MAG: alpha/beta hydrolase [Rhodobacter sp.]|nr:alpha/beta hydrolase [Rhodobacter sp.]